MKSREMMRKANAERARQEMRDGNQLRAVRFIDRKKEQNRSACRTNRKDMS